MFAAPNAFLTGATTLQTVTFTSNGTWTAPGNVSLVTTISGKGSDGVSDSTGPNPTSYGAYFVSRLGGSGSLGPHTWDELYAIYTTFASTYNSGSGVVSSFSFPYDNGGRIGTNDSFDTWTTSSTLTGTNLIRGSVTLLSNTAPTTGSITYAQITSPLGLTYRWDVYSYGYAGAASTGLGQTFPGGAYVAPTGYPATTTTFTNVTVTPSTSYSIVVPSGGTVSISYYA
jgi:hypothetical protein